jgi:hypothetical protein
MTTLLNNKGLSKSEMAVAVEMEILHELEAIRNSIASEKESDGSTSHTMRLMSLRGKESALVHILEFMSKNMKK